MSPASSGAKTEGGARSSLALLRSTLCTGGEALAGMEAEFATSGAEVDVDVVESGMLARSSIRLLGHLVRVFGYRPAKYQAKVERELQLMQVADVLLGCVCAAACRLRCRRVRGAEGEIGTASSVM